jgi:RND family efflux transporter MFP subunit
MTLSGLDSRKSQRTKDIATGVTFRRVWFAAVVPLLVAALLAGACGNSADQRQGRGTQSVSVHTTPVLRMSVQRQIDLAGTLLSPDQAKISAESGGIVRQVLVEIGSEVIVGTPLVRLETKELALALERAEAALRQTRAQLGMRGPLNANEPPPPDEETATVKTATANREDARATYERAKVLSDRGMTSTEVKQLAETKYKVAEAAYEAALDSVHATKALLQDRRAAYDLAAKALADAVVRAPIAGVVAERPAQVGEYIPARTQVATIVQMDPLKLRTGVQERHAGIVTPGLAAQFRVESFGERVFNGKVAYISPSLDQTMRTFTVEALVDNKERLLKPGFFAKGVILTKLDENVMAVPDAAVSVLAGVPSVYVVNDGTIAQTSVTLGVRQGDNWEIVEGLKGDEVLAASRLNELATGVKVRVLKPGESETGAAEGGGRGGEGTGRRGAGSGRSGQGGRAGRSGAAPQGGGGR